MGLKTNHIVEGTGRIVLAELNDCIRSLEIAVTRSLVIIRIFQANRFHGTIEHGLNTSLGHNLDGHAAFKVFFLLKLIEGSFFGCCQGLVKGHKFFLGHGAVEIGSLPLIIARFEIDLAAVNS